MKVSKLINASFEKIYITTSSIPKKIIKTLRPGEAVTDFFVPNLAELVMRALVVVVLPREAKNRWNAFNEGELR